MLSGDFFEGISAKIPDFPYCFFSPAPVQVKLFFFFADAFREELQFQFCNCIHIILQKAFIYQVKREKSEFSF